MHWFKIILLVWIAFEIIECVARASGWQSKKHNPAVWTIFAIVGTLLFMGIWLLI